VEKSTLPDKNRDALDEFLTPFEIMPFDDRAAEVYGRIRTVLERKGTPIGSMDMLIAAHALSLGVALVTNNAKEFKRVPHLQVVNWV
jgi:tRNA(fMet)-specific endonuclease VapC